MKGTSVVSFLITLLLAGAVCIQGQEPVKDTNGDPVLIGEEYYMLPVNTTEDGLVPFPVTLDPFCPYGISQGLFPKSLGLPVSFAFPNPTTNTITYCDDLGLPVSFAFPNSTTKTIVKTYYDVTIEFKSNCTEFSKYWQVDETSTCPRESKVIVGGNPERKNSWFQIKEYCEGEGTNTYKFTTCTAGTVRSIPGPWSSSASELVITRIDEFKTLLVKFQKVDDRTTHAKV